MNQKQEEKQVTVTISATEYDALAKIAEAMNGVGWCGNDNTVASIIEGFALTTDTDNVIENIINGLDPMTTDAQEVNQRLAALYDAIADALA